jgi:DNA-binding CsgD family transcriptional regulator
MGPMAEARRASPELSSGRRFAIIDSEASSANSLARWVGYAKWTPWIAPTLDLDSIGEVGSSCGGAIVALNAQGDLEKAVRSCRALFPIATLAVVGDRNLDGAIKAQDLGLYYICREATFASVFGFADRIAAALSAGSEDDDTASLAKYVGLTKKEADVLRIGVRTASHKEICSELSISDNTLKTLVRRMLARARLRGIYASSLDELIAAPGGGAVRG